MPEFVLLAASPRLFLFVACIVYTFSIRGHEDLRSTFVNLSKASGARRCRCICMAACWSGELRVRAEPPL